MPLDLSSGQERPHRRHGSRKNHKGIFDEYHRRRITGGTKRAFPWRLADEWIEGLRNILHRPGPAWRRMTAHLDVDDMGRPTTVHPSSAAPGRRKGCSSGTYRVQDMSSTVRGTLYGVQYSTEYINCPTKLPSKRNHCVTVDVLYGTVRYCTVLY